MSHIVVIFDHLGPYHIARLEAAGKKGYITALEIAGGSVEYAWKRMYGTNSFRRVTLFPDSNSCDLSSNTIKQSIWSALSNLKPDIVAIPGWSETASLVSLKWCIKTQTPSIVMSASTLLDAPRYWLLERIKKSIVSLFHSALVGGQRQKEYLEMLGMQSDKIFTGYNVVDNDYFALGADNARKAEDVIRHQFNLPGRYFLSVNRFVKKKNIELLIAAFARYKYRTPNSDWKLVLVGDGPMKAEILRWCGQYGQLENVILPGFVQYEELPYYYGLASIFVHTSITEQWGLVVNEAMSAGLPVIVSRQCGCVPDLVKEGQNGYQFDPDDVEHLAVLMEKISSSESHMNKLGVMSKKIISEWKPERFANGLIEASISAKQSRNTRASYLSTFLCNLALQR